MRHGCLFRYERPVRLARCVQSGDREPSSGRRHRYVEARASAQYKDKAWFRAALEANRLAFHIRPFQGVSLTRDTYAYYAGHLIETFIRHFPKMFTITQATPSAAGDDAPF